MKVWQCSVCKYIHKGSVPPEKCPVCNVPARKFKEIDEASIPEKKPKRKKVVEAQKPAPESIVEVSNLEKIYLLLVKHHAHP
ncbi:MAG: rubredoxin, partial [Desulfobacteraceae bacterium]|nr:rubredoxin [Desulfobacteraceae bacterium]